MGVNTNDLGLKPREAAVREAGASVDGSCCSQPQQAVYLLFPGAFHFGAELLDSSGRVGPREDGAAVLAGAIGALIVATQKMQRQTGALFVGGVGFGAVWNAVVEKENAPAFISTGIAWDSSTRQP